MMARLIGPVASPVGWRMGLILAACVAVTIQLADPLQPPSQAMPTTAADPVGREAQARERADYSAIAAHPLTQATRQPWARAAPPPLDARRTTVPPPSDYALAGLVLSGGTPSAILKPSNLGKSLVIGEGETLNGWTLRRIDALGLHFEADGRAYDLGFPIVPADGR